MSPVGQEEPPRSKRGSMAGRSTTMAWCIQREVVRASCYARRCARTYSTAFTWSHCSHRGRLTRTHCLSLGMAVTPPSSSSLPGVMGRRARFTATRPAQLSHKAPLCNSKRSEDWAAGLWLCSSTSHGFHHGGVVRGREEGQQGLKLPPIKYRPPAFRLEIMESNAHRFRLIGVTTAGLISTTESRTVNPARYCESSGAKAQQRCYCF
jgi:hypothetical protein